MRRRVTQASVPTDTWGWQRARRSRRGTVIAAIAASQGFIVAMRDTSAFDAAGIEVIDPWEAKR